MSIKDKEAFDEFFEEDSLSQMEHRLFLAMSENQRIIFASERSWYAACQHKQKEIDELKLKIMDIKGKRNKVEFENAKLKECVEFYAKQSNWMGWHRDVDSMPFDTEPAKAISDEFDIMLGGKRARQCLKELGEK